MATDDVLMMCVHQCSGQYALTIHHLKYMASSHQNVKKETQHVLFMVNPCNTSEGV